MKLLFITRKRWLHRLIIFALRLLDYSPAFDDRMRLRLRLLAQSVCARLLSVYSAFADSALLCFAAISQERTTKNNSTRPDKIAAPINFTEY